MSRSPLPPDEPRVPTAPDMSRGETDANLPPRLRRPNRQQIIEPRTYDELVPHDHKVRAVWALVQSWNLALFLERIRARGERPGRAATDPQLLIALWLYATIEGVNCGRKLDRLCRESDPYKWLCGGVSLNYHTLNDFRVDYGDALDDLLNQMIAALVEAGIVSVARVAQDGTRVRASAGINSFGEQATLEEHLKAAREHLEAVKHDVEEPTMSARQRAARLRGARDRVERLEQALNELKKVAQAKARQKEKPTKDHPARASSTDPEARLMRMPDGGTRPAYNLELATDCDSRAIVGVEVTNAGNDAGQDVPMRDQVEMRADEAVEEQLMDGGCLTLEAIDRAAAEEVTIFAPVPKPRSEGVDRYAPKPTDSEAVAHWRQRMSTADAQRLYKQRSATIETINGELKSQRGLGPMTVRGLKKVQTAVMWPVLAHNLVHLGAILLSG